MGTIPESIPYEEFLELRKEVDSIRSSLNLALRILGGIAGFADEQITQELRKELAKKKGDINIKVLVPNNTKTFFDYVNFANEESMTDPLELEELRAQKSEEEDLPVNPTSSTNVYFWIGRNLRILQR